MRKTPPVMKTEAAIKKIHILFFFRNKKNLSSLLFRFVSDICKTSEKFHCLHYTGFFNKSKEIAT
ncbi:MAG TPA: hypothetical protein DDW34_02445 [Clostridium sp.]|nr:hypothetical protein [Clostridium sp.]